MLAVTKTTDVTLTLTLSLTLSLSGIMELSLSSTFAAMSEAKKCRGTLATGSKSDMKLLSPGAKMSWNFRSRE